MIEYIQYGVKIGFMAVAALVAFGIGWMVLVLIFALIGAL